MLSLLGSLHHCLTEHKWLNVFEIFSACLREVKDTVDEAETYILGRGAARAVTKKAVHTAKRNVVLPVLRTERVIFAERTFTLVRTSRV